MSFFYFSNGFVLLKLDPLNMLGIGIEEITNMASPETNILDASKLELFPQIDENRANIFSIWIRTLEFCFIGFCAEVKSIVTTFTKDGLAS